MKIKLIMFNDYNDTEDKFKFKSLDDLFKFINELTVEKLIDDDFTDLYYRISVEE